MPTVLVMVSHFRFMHMYDRDIVHTWVHEIGMDCLLERMHTLVVENGSSVTNCLVASADERAVHEVSEYIVSYVEMRTDKKIPDLVKEAVENFCEVSHAEETARFVAYVFDFRTENLRHGLLFSRMLQSARRESM